MNTSDIIILITILAYMGMMVVIGAVFSKKNSSVGDFYLGGRKLGPVVTAMSAEASDMSSWLLILPINAVIHHLTNIANLKATLPLTAAVILILISMFLTLISGLIPSRSAAKKDPVVALRTE